MEILDFSKHEKDWWAWLMCEHPKAVEAITSKPGFKGDALEVSITVNGVSVVAADFNGFMEAITQLSTDQRIRKLGLHSIQEAAQIQARAMMKGIVGQMEDDAHALLNSLQNMTDSVDSMVRANWESSLSSYGAGEKIKDALAKAVVEANLNAIDGHMVSATTSLETSGPKTQAVMRASGFGVTEGEARVNLERAVFHLLGISPIASDA